MPGKEQRALQKKYLIAAVSVCLFFLISSLIFVFYMMMQHEEENIQYLNNAAYQHNNTILKQIQGDFQTLNGTAVCINELEDSTEAQMRAILTRVNVGNSFLCMGLAGRDGKTDFLGLDGKSYPGIDLSDKDFFQQALAGDNSISDVRVDTLAEGGIHCYGVPVKNSAGEITGVLCAVSASSVFREIVDAPLLNEAGFSNLLSGDGTLMIRSHNPAMADVLTLADLGGIRSRTMEELQAHMQAGKNINFTFTAGGVEQLGVIMAVGCNNWFVLSSIPMQVLQGRYVVTAVGIVVLILMACAIFLFFFELQRRMGARNQQILMHLAYDDPLTGSRNFQKFLLEAPTLLHENAGEHFAIWYCDLKKFKYFNDVFGYQMGDEMLRRMGCLFEQLSVPHSSFCRASADNFAGIRPYTSTIELEDWFCALLELVRTAETESANRLHMELCMGFYCVEPGDESLSMNDMVNRANMAQKSAKNLPGSQVAFFTQRIRAQNLMESELEAQSEQAMVDGQFKLYLQPKVSIQGGNRIAGAEVLSRWIHPEKGLIPPSVFVPVFEKNGMVIQLDRYMLEESCRWLRGYLDEGRPPIKLAINVSRLDMLREDFVEYYTMVKSFYDIPNGLLELEFTESVIIDGDDLFLKTVNELQHHGYSCAMDDFGSGYSSLNLLKNLPFDVLKLDILFFRYSIDMKRERTVISNVIRMAKELNIRTVAEGVETIENVDFLREAGCDLVQGFAFFQPLPMEDFDQLLREHGGEEMVPRNQI